MPSDNTQPQIKKYVGKIGDISVYSDPDCPPSVMYFTGSIHNPSKVSLNPRRLGTLTDFNKSALAQTQTCNKCGGQLHFCDYEAWNLKNRHK